MLRNAAMRCSQHCLHDATHLHLAREVGLEAREVHEEDVGARRARVEPALHVREVRPPRRAITADPLLVEDSEVTCA